jgi:hypothetical protein
MLTLPEKIHHAFNRDKGGLGWLVKANSSLENLKIQLLIMGQLIIIIAKKGMKREVLTKSKIRIVTLLIST